MKWKSARETLSGFRLLFCTNYSKMYITLICVIVLFSFVSDTFGTDCVIVESLNGKWIVENLMREVDVPGSIYSELEDSNVLNSSIYNGFNDQTFRWVSKLNWTYFKEFTVNPDLLKKKRIILTFDGLDTVSNIFLNGKPIGASENMFVRYSFDVKDLLNEGINVIKVEFESPVHYSRRKYEEQLNKYVVPPHCVPPEYNGECHANHIRKMQASFSWDWGPAFPSVGIWKNVQLEGFDEILVRDIMITPKSYNGSWNVTVVSFLDIASTSCVVGEIRISISCGATFTEKLETKPDSQLELVINKTVSTDDCADVKEWWPNGMGEQQLYMATVCFVGITKHCKSVNFGFRTIELVEEPISGQSGGLTFYFRVNGRPFFAKGSNWIPAHVLPERVTPEHTEELLLSAKEAHMNMLRVWGGGIYESDTFYELADAYGILIWQDFMFACSMYPAEEEFLQSVTKEVTHQVKRLQHHPSIAVWAGNNENEKALADNWYGTKENFSVYHADYVKLYVETIRENVLSLDQSRPFIVSSPTNGLKSVEEEHVARKFDRNLYGDIHHYDYKSNGWEWKSYPIPRFSSEYGFQSIPSMETLAQVSEREDWSLYSEFMASRQHRPQGNSELWEQVKQHFKCVSKEDVSTQEGFEKFIYLTQINQAMSTKTETEVYRRHRTDINDKGEGFTMGALYWQLNDIWQGISWSSIEYGGRWKMLHYYAARFFNPLLVFPYLDKNELNVYVISDLEEPVENATLGIEVYKWKQLAPVHTDSIDIEVDAEGAFRVHQEYVDGLLRRARVSKHTALIRVTLKNGKGEEISPDNFLFLNSALDTKRLSDPNLKVTNISMLDSKAEPYKRVFYVELCSEAIALFVWFEVEGVKGRFSDNGFIMNNQSDHVYFFSRDEVTADDLKQKLSVKSFYDVCKK